MRVLGIIPSRYNSTRFPGKALADILGKSMIQRVYEQALNCTELEDIIVATDDERIFSHVKGFGGKTMMTSKNHKSGTDRCAEISSKLTKEYDVIVNIQGDEPFINKKQISKLIKLFSNNKTQIATLAKKITEFNDYINENKVKVFFNDDNVATTFERKSILNQKEFIENSIYKHIGIYAYRKSILEEITKIKPSKSEIELKLEQLRWTDQKYEIKVEITEYESYTVDTKSDILKILELNPKSL